MKNIAAYWARVRAIGLPPNRTLHAAFALASICVIAVTGCSGEANDIDGSGAPTIGSVGLEANLCARCNDGNPCTVDTCTNPTTGACAFTPASSDTVCDDKNACSTNDRCNGAGACRGTLLDCNDNNSCTNDSCNKATGCSYSNNTASCNDNNKCTTSDRCSAGSCAGTPKNCGDDGNPCTDDVCNPATGACSRVNNTAPCAPDTNPCTNDVCAGGACTHPSSAGVCNDGNACTDGDQCVAGSCQGSPLSCNDGNICTDDSCDPATGCAYSANTSACDSDGDLCTSDLCSGGSCTHSSNGLICNDGNVCTDDFCNPATGLCSSSPNAASCNDGNACTTADQCAAGACSGSAVTCNDDNPCTDDTCNPATGSCVFAHNTGPCESDGNDCTTDVCSDGVCAHIDSGTCECTQATAATACNDNNPCTDDVCAGGSCTHPSNTAPCASDDNPCTDDVCAGGSCTHPSNTAPCSDGNPCTSEDHCAAGACTGAPLGCDDGNACTDDSCNPATGCVHAANTAPCEGDGDLCTNDVCSDGSCTHSSNGLTCNDSNPCTDDSCNPATGLCSTSPNTASCNDGNACTTADQCAAGACSGSAVTCNDSNPCTDDTCNSTTGSCVFTHNTAPCASDGNNCTTDVCGDGVCNHIDSGTCECTPATAATDCNDNNPCTTDTCNAGACAHSNNTASCNDNSLCTTVDACAAGVCVGSSPLNCNDNDPCTNDACNAATGCTHVVNTPACSTDANLKVAFAGDTSTGANWANVLNLIKNEGAAALVVAGDMSYSDNPAAWWNTTESVLGTSFPVFLSRGNHDDGTWAAYLTKAADHLGGATRVAGDHDAHYKTIFRGLAIATIRKGDTAASINSLLQNDHHLWKICSWHQNQAAMQVGNKADEMGWEVYEACKEHGAIIQTGHEHSYSRTKTIINMAAQTLDFTCTSATNLCVSKGRTFVTVSGLGGNSIRGQDRCLPTTPPYGCGGLWGSIYTSSQSATYGAQFITFNVDGNPKKANGYFKAINGTVADTFNITYSP